jgi:hypothetical protein
MAGTGNLILKRGTGIPFNSDDASPILFRGAPAVQISGLSNTSDGSSSSGNTQGPYAVNNYPNRLWMGMKGYGLGTGNDTGTATAEDFEGLGITPLSMSGGTTTNTDEYTRPLWMGAEIRAFTPIKKDNSDAYHSILKADWDRPSDYVLVTQQAIAFAPNRMWALGTPYDFNGAAMGGPIRKYVEFAVPSHTNNAQEPWSISGNQYHKSKKIIYPVVTPSDGQTLVVAQNGVNTSNSEVDVITLEWAQGGGGGSSLTLNGDSGTASVADTTETIVFSGASGIRTLVSSVGSTNTVSVALDIDELSQRTPILNDSIVITDSANTDVVNNRTTLTNIRNLIRDNLNITGLSSSAAITNDDTLIIDEGGVTKKATVGNLVDWIGSAGSSHVAVSNTGQTTINNSVVTNAMLATASTTATADSVALRNGSGNLVANLFDGPSSKVKGTATTTGTTHRILFATDRASDNMTVGYDNNLQPLVYDAANSKLIVQNLQVIGTEEVTTKLNVSVATPVFTLNSDLPVYSNAADGTSQATPSENARIIVNRGAEADSELRWNETTEKWDVVATNKFTNAITQIARSTTAGVTVTYTCGISRPFDVSEYVSISGLTANKHYNNLWKVNTSTIADNPVTAASLGVLNFTEKTVNYSTITVNQNTPSTGRTQFVVTHNFTYAMPTGAQNITITGNTTSTINNTYNSANVSASTATSLTFDVLTSTYTGLSGISGANVASANNPTVVSTANGASAETITTSLNCDLVGVNAYPIIYGDGNVSGAAVGTGKTQYIDKLVVNNLTMAGTWNLQSTITTDLDLQNGGLKLPRSTTNPPVGSVLDEGRIFWDTDNDTLYVGTASGSKTFVDTDSTQTLTGKTLTSPTISGTPVISGGSINNTTIGASNPSTGAFTTLSSTGATTAASLSVTGTATFSGAATVDGAATFNGNVSIGNQTSDTITLGGSFINGTVLRAAAANNNTLSIAAWDTDATAQYRNLLTVTSGSVPSIAIGGADVSGTINNVSIGASNPSTGVFTSVGINNSAITTGNLITTTGTTTGAKFNIAAATITTGTSSVGTYADLPYASIAAPTFTNTTNAITIKEASTLYLATPVAGSNVTLTNAYSLKTTGSVKIGGSLVFEGSTDNDNEITFSITDPGSNVTITVPAWSGTMVVPSGTSSSGYLVVGTASQPAWTDNDSVVVGGVYFRNETTGTTTTRYPLAFLANQRTEDNPTTFGTLSDAAKTTGYLKTHWETGEDAGLYYAPGDVADTAAGNGKQPSVNGGTLYAGFFAGYLDCGTY